MRFSKYFIFLCLIIFFPVVINAQEDKQAYIFARIFNEKGVLLTELKQENIRLFEEGKPLEIKSLKYENIPLSVGILFDISPSMTKNFRDNTINRISWGRQSALDFLSESNSANDYFVMTFSEKTEVLSDFTSRSEAAEVIKNETYFKTPKKVSTGIYDAIKTAGEKMANVKNQRKVLFILSDGQDKQVFDNFKRVEELAKTLNTAIFILAINDPTENDLYGLSGGITTSQRATDLTELTGGYFSSTQNLKQAREFAVNAARTLQNQYAIGFVPDASKNSNKWRKLELKIELSPEERKKQGKITAFYPKGYYLN